MVEKVLKGSPKYYMWLIFLTGLTRNTSWGFYIAQFTYLVGVAAAAVMLVLPATFHHYHPYHRVIVFAEFLAIGAVIMCMLFIVVDMGQPQRVLNVILHPTPNSVMFWDCTVLCGYLILNAVIGWTSLEHESRHVAVPRWVKVLVVISIFWAFSSPSTPSRPSCTQASPAAITGSPPSWPPASWPPPSVPVLPSCCSRCCC